MASTAFPRMSVAALRQPQCTAPAARPFASQSSTGTQSALKQKRGNPIEAVTMPSAS